MQKNAGGLSPPGGCDHRIRTHAKRSDRLAAAGFGASEIARIRGPVGLAIGALTPAEIALSILAEVTAVLHRAGLAVRPGEAA